MGKWVAVQGMKLKPYNCAGCGQTPMTGTERGSEDGPKQAYFCEGVDINWGDALYICDSCARVIGQLAGFIEPDQADDLQRTIDRLEEELKETTEDRDTLQNRIDRMLDGKAAIKEARAAKPRKKVTA